MFARRPRARSMFGSRKAAAIKALAKKVVYQQRETKWVCKSITSTPLTSTITNLAGVLNDIDAGDGESNRDGLKCKQLGLKMRMGLNAASDRPQSVRILVLERRDDFTSSDIPQSMTACVTPKMRTHFNVVLDTIRTITPSVDDSSSLFRAVYLTKYIRRAKTLSFPDGVGSNLEDNALSLWIIRDNLAGGTDVVDVYGDFVCYFKEM